MEYSDYLNLNLPSINNTVDLAIIDDISENFDKLDKKADEVDGNIEQNASDIEGLRIINTASGSSIALKDSAIAKLRNLKVFGKTTQDGTPTPDNPIELKSVGDSGSYNVDLYGKNLFNINGNVNLWGYSGVQTNLNSVSNNILTSNADVSQVDGVGQKIKVNVGDTITFSAKTIDIGTGSSVRLAIYDNGNLKVYIYGGLNKISKLTYTAETSNLIFTFGTGGGTGAQFTDIQVEYGTEVTPYEPYKAKQTFTNTDALRGIGDIADEKDFARGIKTQRFNSVDLSTLSWSYTTGGYWRSSSISSLIDIDPIVPKMLATNYVASGWYDHYAGAYIAIDNFGAICVFNTNAETKPTGTLIYKLATPIETPLAETELNDYKKLYTKKPNTTIISEAEMEVSYVADPKNYIDNKIAELTALTLEV